MYALMRCGGSYTQNITVGVRVCDALNGCIWNMAENLCVAECVQNIHTKYPLLNSVLKSFHSCITFIPFPESRRSMSQSLSDVFATWPNRLGDAYSICTEMSVEHPAGVEWKSAQTVGMNNWFYFLNFPREFTDDTISEHNRGWAEYFNIENIAVWITSFQWLFHAEQNRTHRSNSHSPKTHSPFHHDLRACVTRPMFIHS